MKRDLLPSLLIEVFQAERAGALHPRKEAERLSGTSPSQAMHELADDCARALEELRVIVQRADLPVTTLGEKLGAAFSVMRDGFADLLVSRETSYRGTLLGVHHGIDAIQLLLTSAEYEKDVEVVEWCMRTLDRRRPLLAKAQHELTWFGHNPDVATEPAKRTLVSKAARVVATGLGAFGLRSR